MSCAAPEQGGPLEAVDGQTVIQGTVVLAGRPVAKAYVRLLDARQEFTAEVVSSRDGEFRFYAAPGQWTLRVLAPGASGTHVVQAPPGVTTVTVQLTAEVAAAH